MDNDYRIVQWCERACSYIKYKPDRKAVEKELLAHIQDKCDALTAEGMPPEDVAKAAVNAMGNADEVGRELENVHNPFWGYMLRISQVLIVIAVIVVLFASRGVQQRFGIFVQREDRHAHLFYEEFREFSDFNVVRTLFVEPEGYAKLDGYTFRVTRAVENRFEYTGRRYPDVSYNFRFTVVATHPLPWAGFPWAVDYFSAIDSLGNFYESRNSGRSYYGRFFWGNPGLRTLFSYTFELSLAGYVPGAEWIELRYNRDGRDFALRIDLGGN